MMLRLCFLYRVLQWLLCFWFTAFALVASFWDVKVFLLRVFVKYMEALALKARGFTVTVCKPPIVPSTTSKTLSLLFRNLAVVLSIFAWLV